MNIPWLINRRKLILLTLVDFLIFFILLINFNQFSYLKFFIYILIAITWVVSSYIIGRYKYLKENKLNLYLKQIAKTYLLCIFIQIFLNLFFKIFFVFFNFNIIEFINFRYFLFFLYATLSQFITLIIVEIYYEKSIYDIKDWYFIGSKKSFKILKSEIKEENKNYNLINFDINNHPKIEEVKNIIIEDLYNLKKSEINFLYKTKKENFQILSLLDWCQLILQRLPSKLISNFEIIKGKFDVNRDSFQSRLKRVSDIFLSIIIIIISSPLILLSSIMIKIEDRNRIIYKQKRTGLNQKIFNIYKLRTMNINAEKDGVIWAKKNDSRITKVGKILRLSRLDEVPQLFAVIKGEMSLIGPRPERPEIEETLEKVIPHYRLRHKIRPGLSGWAQVNYPYGSSIRDTEMKVSYDLYYIKNISLFLDILILFKTLRLVFNFKGAVPKK